MSIVRYKTWPGVDRWHRDFHRLWDATAETQWRPAVDVLEQDDSYQLSADIPGIDPTDIEITVDKNVLTIQGERNREDTVKKDGYTRYERVSGKFVRKFTLPEDADGETVSANGKNGVLTVSIPKKAAAQPKRITVAA